MGLGVNPAMTRFCRQCGRELPNHTEDCPLSDIELAAVERPYRRLSPTGRSEGYHVTGRTGGAVSETAQKALGEIQRRGKAAIGWVEWWVRLFLLVGLFCPVLMIWVALQGSLFWTSLTALVPAICFAVMMVSMPRAFLIPDFVGLVPGLGRQGGSLEAKRRLLLALLGGECLFGIYLTLVPVTNDPALLPLLVLVTVAGGCFWFSDHPGLMKLMGWLAAGLAVVFFLGGRGPAKQWLSQTYYGVSQPVSSEASRPGSRPHRHGYRARE